MIALLARLERGTVALLPTPFFFTFYYISNSCTQIMGEVILCVRRVRLHFIYFFLAYIHARLSHGKSLSSGCIQMCASRKNGLKAGLGGASAVTR
jgi:hypothetical protein